jgi:hypothetical protein
MRKKRVRPSVLSENDVAKTSDIIKNLTEEALKFPAPDAHIPLLMRIPVVYPPFMFKSRISTLTIYSGYGAKHGLIEEMGLHILVDTLFLTVVCVPVFEPFDSMNPWVTACLALFYFTCILLLCSIVCQVVWICAFVQVKDRYD